MNYVLNDSSTTEKNEEKAVLQQEYQTSHMFYFSPGFFKIPSLREKYFTLIILTPIIIFIYFITFIFVIESQNMEASEYQKYPKHDLDSPVFVSIFLNLTTKYFVFFGPAFRLGSAQVILLPQSNKKNSVLNYYCPLKYFDNYFCCCNLQVIL